MDVYEVLKWREVVIDKSPDFFDILSVQCYHQGWNSDKIIQHYDAICGVMNFKKDLQDIINDLHLKGLRKRVF